MVICAKVKKRNAERARRFLIARGVFDKGHAPVSDKNHVYFPVTAKSNFKLIDSFVEKRLASFEKMKVSGLPGFDIIGDVAIFEIPRESASLKGKERSAEVKRIARDILCQHSNIKTVAVKTGAISGVYRLRKFKVVAGRKSTVTFHKEHGCVFKVDPAKVYYSPRLSFERQRINGLVKRGETVIVPFAGVGPSAIIIAKSHPDAKVVANELNPTGFKQLKENIKLNRTFNVIAEPGDARKLLKKYAGTADRVLMPLPMSSDKFLDMAFGLCRSGGIVHFYWFTDSIRTAEDMVIRRAKEGGRKVKILASKLVREYSPNIIEAVIDFKVI